MLVPNKNLQGYKEHDILFIAFAFGEGVNIIYWISNMKLYDVLMRVLVLRTRKSCPNNEAVWDRTDLLLEPSSNLGQ